MTASGRIDSSPILPRDPKPAEPNVIDVPSCRSRQTPFGRRRNRASHGDVEGARVRPGLTRVSTASAQATAATSTTAAVHRGSGTGSPCTRRLSI